MNGVRGSVLHLPHLRVLAPFGLRAAAAACLAWSGVAAHAQAGGGLRIVPAVDFTASVVDNTLQAPAGQIYNGAGDFVTVVRPSVQINGSLGRTRLALYYALDIYHHSRGYPGRSAAEVLNNSLNATLNTELVERWMFLDAAATVTQQAVSAYGQQTVDAGQYSLNRTEVTQLTVHPYVRGSLANVATYEVAATGGTSQSRGGLAPDSTNSALTMSLGSPSGGALLGWSAQATRQQSEFSGGDKTDNSRFTASLLIRPDPEVSGSLRAGRESVHIGSFYDASYTNWGGDIRWIPSPRTSANLSVDSRYFGRGYTLALDHRIARASMRFSSSRDTTNGANATGVGQPVTLYQLFYNQFASIQPDPALRDQLVRDFISSLGRDPNTVVSGGFVNGGVTLQRREDLALGYNGLRTTYTLQAFGSRTSSLGSAATNFNGGPVRQFGMTTSVSYRLTPTSSASLTGSVLRTSGNGVQAGNHLDSVVLSWSERLGRYTTTSVNARYTVFDGPLNPYRESSLSATLGLRF